jgi:hypothetical protein
MRVRSLNEAFWELELRTILVVKQATANIGTAIALPYHWFSGSPPNSSTAVFLTILGEPK